MRQKVKQDGRFGGVNILERQLFVVLAVAGAFVVSVDAANTVTYDMNGSGGWNDATRWVGGTVPVSGDTVEIPAGRAVVATEDYSLYKTLNIKMLSSDSILSFTAENGSQYYTPIAKNNQVSGPGTIEKASEKLWCLSYSAKAFTGDWDIKQGAVTWADTGNNSLYYFGTNSTTAMPSGRIFIRSGAYFNTTGYSMTDKSSLGYKEVHIAGRNATGTDSGIGAIHCGTWAKIATNILSCVVLDDDAYITGTGGGTAVGVFGTNPDLPGYLDLNGHNLYLNETRGRPFTFRLRNVLVTNSVPSSGGTIYVGGNSIANKHVVRIDKDVVFDANVKLVPTNYGQVIWNNSDDESPIPVKAGLVVGGSATNLVVAHAMTRDQTNRTDWAGSVEIPSGQTLRVDGMGGATQRALISGPVSGAGNIAIGPNDRGQLVLGGNNSSFTGNVSIDGRSGSASMMALKPESIPDFSKVTVKGGTLAACMPGWSFSQYLNLANGVTYSNDSGDVNNPYISSVTMCLDGMDDANYSLNIANGQITDYANVTLGVSGTGTVNVASLPSEGRVRLANYGGTLRFSGSTPYKPGTILATSFADGADVGKIVFDGASDVDIGSEEIFVGGLDGLGPSSAAGAMYVTNSLIYNHGSDSMSHHEGIGVGQSGTGYLEVVDSCITGRLQMAGTAASVASTVLKTGSRLVSWGYRGSSNITNATLVAKFGHGYLEIDGGEFVTRGGFYASLYGAAGVIVQKSGSLKVGAEAGGPFSLMHVGTHKGSNPLRAVGQYWLKGGTGWCSHQLWVASGGNSGSYDHGTVGVVTIDGSDATFTVETQSILLGLSPDSYGIINLRNGGSLNAKSINGRNPALTHPSVSCLNFDGGIYSYVGWGANWLFGKEGQTEEDKAPLSHVTVFKGGGKIRFLGSDSKFVGRPICAPTGKGVSSVAWSDTAAEFPACPAVVIEGDGYGASAMCDYDSDTRRVSGIVVTSPGCDYTAAVAYVRVGNVTNRYELACTLADNDPSGGMTFRHENTGKLRFDEVNTYRGQTTLESRYSDAEFVISNKDAFASSSAIALKGGTLNVAGFTLAELTAPFKFMGGRIAGDAASYTVPEGKMIIDCEDILAGETYTIAKNTNVVFPETVTLLNVDKILDKQDYVLLTLPDNYSGPFAFSGLEGARFVKRRGNTYKLCYCTGTQIVFR